MDFHSLFFKVHTFLATTSISDISRDLQNYANHGEICFDNIGCFVNDERNPCTQLTVLPYHPQEFESSFQIYTPEIVNGTIPQYIDYADTSNITGLIIDPNRPLFVVVHGFSQVSPFGKFLRPLKDVLIDKGNNVLLIDWIKGADYPNYPQAASNARVIGAMLANVLVKLDNDSKSFLDKTTVIGFSVGVHAAGFTGKALALKQKQVRSIVGLDPSRDRFTNVPPQCRLATGDAKFVQVFHCGAGPADSDVYATKEPIGDVDIYFNGGKTVTQENKCSHDLSYVYYTESVRDANADHGCKFMAFPCKNADEWQAGTCLHCSNDIKSGQCATAGYEAGVGSRGIFFVDTLSENKTHGRYCGWQYTFTFASDTEVKGEIALVLPGPNGTQEKVIFQEQDEILEASKLKTRVVVFPYAITGKAAGLSLVYRKYTSILWASGPDSWTVDQAYISDATGKTATTTKILQKQPIKDGEQVPLGAF